MICGELLVEPDAPLMDLLGGDGAVVEPALLAKLEVGIGETLLLGGAEFTVRGTVLREPDRVNVAFATGRDSRPGQGLTSGCFGDLP